MSKLILLLLVTGISGFCQATSKLSALRQSIFYGYDKFVKPDEPVIVKFGMNLLNLDICPHQQILTTHAWLHMKWVDSRLKWNPEDFNNVKLMRIEPGLIWIPDIVPYNGEQQRPTFATIKGDIPSVIVDHTGVITFVPPVSQRTFCTINHDNWPWGEQNCTLIFGSWTYDMGLVDLVFGTEGSMEPVGIKEFQNSRIEVVSTSHTRIEAIYDCCPEAYPNIALSIVFKQKSMFHHGKLLTPDTVSEGKKHGSHKHESSEENH